MKPALVPLALLLALAVAGGCQTSAQTGALAGSGIGALAGQAIGGNTTSTLVGAAVGAGVGYVIGNEKDKKKAAEMTQSSPAPAHPHSEVGPLGGTRWNLVSLEPRSVAKPYLSKTLEFRRDGRVITTTTREDRSVEVFDESYRVVEDTLIINKPGYLVNAKFSIADDQMVVSAQEFRAVLKRLR